MSSSDTGKKVRIIHNVPGGPNVDIYVNKRLFVENLSYKNVTAYLDLDTNKIKISVVPTGSSTVLLYQRLRLKSEFTSLIIDRSDPLRLVVLSDRLKTPRYGYSRLRFISNTHQVQVYINGVHIDKLSNSKYYNYKLTGDVFTFIEVKSNDVILVSMLVPITSQSILTLILSGIQDNSDYPLTLITGYDNGVDTYRFDKLKRNFSPQKYMGKWYQIADIPQFYEIGCARATAQYTLLQTNVNVFNSCFDKDWVLLDTINGSAVIFNPQYPSVLTVSFPPPFIPNKESPPIIPSGPNYIVHYTDYESYALVGSPLRNSLYILSRDPQMKFKVYDGLVDRAKHLGYDISKLKLNYDSLK